MRYLVLYHKIDLDGWCSAAIVKYALHNQLSTDDLVFLGWNYGDQIPHEAIEQAELVIMVDISLPWEVMGQVANKLVWIDHHKSAIEEVETKFKQMNLPLPDGRRDTRFAACELAWDFFFPEIDTPKTVELLGLYDSFRHKSMSLRIQNEVMYFQYAARAWITNYHDIETLPRFFNADGPVPDRLIKQGEVIYKYLVAEAQGIYSKKSELNFEEPHGEVAASRKFAIVNRERFNPINFGIDYHSEGYEGFACYWDSGTTRYWSLYNDDGRVDCSAICKALGGGGHKGAAGFTQTIEEIKV